MTGRENEFVIKIVGQPLNGLLTFRIELDEIELWQQLKEFIDGYYVKELLGLSDND